MYYNNTHKLTFPIILLTLFSCTKSNLRKEDAVANGGDTITVNEFYQMKDEPNTVILDVRTPEEFSKSHVAEAIHINFHDTLNFKSNINKLDTGKTYLIYCRTDRRSGKTFELMKEMNFKNIHVLKGGILAIQESGKPLNSDSNK